MITFSPYRWLDDLAFYSTTLCIYGVISLYSFGPPTQKIASNKKHNYEKQQKWECFHFNQHIEVAHLMRLYACQSALQ
jgi:hypothetical protein